VQKDDNIQIPLANITRPTGKQKSHSAQSSMSQPQLESLTITASSRAGTSGHLRKVIGDLAKLPADRVIPATLALEARR
jgi:hypothetical protein